MIGAGRLRAADAVLFIGKSCSCRVTLRWTHVLVSILN